MTFYQCINCERVLEDHEMLVEDARPQFAWLAKNTNAPKRYACPGCNHHFFEITLVV